MVLLALLQWSRPEGRFWLPGAAHGALGVAGLLGLLAALSTGKLPTGGTSESGALTLLGAALLAGILLFTGRLIGRPLETLTLALHMIFAAAGVIMLGAWLYG